MLSSKYSGSYYIISSSSTRIILFILNPINGSPDHRFVSFNKHCGLLCHQSACLNLKIKLKRKFQNCNFYASVWLLYFDPLKKCWKLL